MGRRTAFLIGSGSYDPELGLSRLAGPANDVAELRRVLRSEFGRFDDVEVSIDQPIHRLRRELESWVTSLYDCELVLLHYSGHGIIGGEDTLYLAAPDTERHLLNSTALGIDFVRTLLNSARDSQRVVLLDACYSGAAENDFSKLREVGELAEARLNPVGVFVLTASAPDEPSREVYSSRYGLVMGRFSEAIVYGVESSAADVDADGVVTFRDLRQYVERELRVQTSRYGIHAAHGDPVIAWTPHGANRADFQIMADRLGRLYKRGIVGPVTYRTLWRLLHGTGNLPPDLRALAEEILTADASGDEETGPILERIVASLDSEGPPKLLRRLSDQWLESAPAQVQPRLHIRDSLYGEIVLPDYLRSLLKQPLLRRLENVSVNPFARHFLPTASYSRMAHTLGVVHLMSELLGRIWMRGEVWMEGSIHRLELSAAERERLERTAHVAALLHDVAAPPWTGSIQSALSSHFRAEPGEDAPTQWLVRKTVAPIIEKDCEVDPEEVLSILSGDADGVGGWLTFISQALNSAIDLDRIDYIQRDSAAIGSFPGFDSRKLLSNAGVYQSDGHFHLVFSKAAEREIETALLVHLSLFGHLYEHRLTRPIRRLAEELLTRLLDRLGSDLEIPTRMRLLADRDLLTLVTEAAGDDPSLSEVAAFFRQGVFPPYNCVARVAASEIHQHPKLRLLLRSSVLRDPELATIQRSCEVEIGKILDLSFPGVVTTFGPPWGFERQRSWGIVVYDNHSSPPGLISGSVLPELPQKESEFEVWVDRELPTGAEERLRSYFSTTR